MAKGQSLQDPFLNALRKEQVPVSIYLVNGIKLQGQIDSFDQFVVLLKNSVSQMVYKHAISTVVPARDVRLAVEEGATRGDCGRVMPPHGEAECSSARAPVSAPCWCAWGSARRSESEDLEEFAQLARLGGRRSRWRPSPAGASGPIRATSSAAARPRRSRRRRARSEAELILVDHALSPSQERNLEKLTGAARARSQRL